MRLTLNYIDTRVIYCFKMLLQLDVLQNCCVSILYFAFIHKLLNYVFIDYALALSKF